MISARSTRSLRLHASRFRQTLLFVTAVLFSPLPLSAEAQSLLVNTSHNGAVEQLSYLEEQQRLVSGGSDGAVQVWDTQTRELLRALQVSQLPIRTLVAHPERPEVAIVVRTSEGYRLSVWDYEGREELFFEELNSEPLHLDYSPQGTWLIYTQTAVDSVVTLNAQTGERERRVGRGTGIAGYFTMGASEANIMTYAPANGRIQYTRMDDGEVLQRGSTIAGLEEMQVLHNRRYAAARDGNDLVIVDIVDGSEVDRTSRRRIRSIVVDEASNRIAVLHGTAGNRGVDIYAFEQNRLRSLERYSGTEVENVSAIAFIRGEVFTGGPDGRMTILTDGEEPDLFTENLLKSIRSVAFGEQSLLVTADGYTSSIQSDFFGTEAMDEEASTRQIRTQSLAPREQDRTTTEVTDPSGRTVDFEEPYERRSATFTTRRALRRISPALELSRSDAFGRDRLPEGTQILSQRDITVSFLDNMPWPSAPATAANLTTTLDNRILLWNSPDFPVSWATVHGPGEPVPGSPDGASVTSVITHDAAVTILYESGVVEQRHPITLQLLQEHEVENPETAAYVRDDMLVVGRNASGMPGSALIRIDPTTGETVNLDTEAFYVFRMAVDRRRGALYVLGLSRSNGGIVTTVERITGDRLRSSEVLFEVPAEDLEADIAVDDRTGTLYVAAGLEGIHVWDGERRLLPPTDHLARRLTVARGKIVSVNGNGTVSIWSQASEQHLGDVYLFDDGRWLAIGADGGFFTADNMTVTDLLRAPDTEEDIASFRTELPVTFAATTVERGVHIEEVIRALGPR